MELARPFGQRSDDLDLRQTFAFTPSRCACRHCVTQQNDKQETGLHSDPGLAKALTPRHLGQPIERHEDAALLTGRGRFADDLGDAPGTLQAAVLRRNYGGWQFSFRLPFLVYYMGPILRCLSMEF